jgi:hypothetical protein
MRAAAAAFVLVAACAAPASLPAGGADLAPADAATADLATSDLSVGVCGNGDCEPGENGANCASDCCDAMTSCDATRGNDGAYFCRSMNGGAFAWYTQNDTLALCDDASQVGVTTWACAAHAGYCCSIPGGYVDGPCP